MKRAFTLIEINLAMLIMAGGVLTVVGLYSLGFRENRQSREDVAASALADAVMSPLVMALSATNLTWSTFNGLKNYPSDRGWGDYFNQSTGVVDTDPESRAENVFSTVMNRVVKGGDIDTAFPSAVRSAANMSCGLVVMHPDDSATVSIAFRAVPDRKFGTLLAMPMFFTEVRFQGVVD